MSACGLYTCDSKIAAKICTICKNIRYCSKSCQRAHWSQHKLVCVNDSTDERLRSKLLFMAMKDIRNYESDHIAIMISRDGILHKYDTRDPQPGSVHDAAVSILGTMDPKMRLIILEPMDPTGDVKLFVMGQYDEMVQR